MRRFVLFRFSSYQKPSAIQARRLYTYTQYTVHNGLCAQCMHYCSAKLQDFQKLAGIILERARAQCVVVIYW